MTEPSPYAEAATDALVVLAKTDRDALGALYDRFFPLVHRYCQRRMFDRAAADDVAADVFLQLAQSLRRFGGTTEEDFRRWVYRIATNAANAQLLKQSRRGRLLDRAGRLGWWTKVEAVDERHDPADFDELAEALGELYERQQSVLTLRFMEGLSYEEVAAILGIRRATLRVIASRALATLRRRLSSRDSRMIKFPTKPKS